MRILLLCALLLSGCSMKNEEVIAEVKVCNDAAMIPKVNVNLNNGVTSVHCWPQQEPSHDK